MEAKTSMKERVIALIEFIRNAEEEESVTNELVAEIFQYMLNHLLDGVNQELTRLSDDIELHRQREFEPLARAHGELVTRFEALLGDNASEAIDNFNEIVAFLEGVEDSDTLLAKLGRVSVVSPSNIEFEGGPECVRMNYEVTNLNGQGSRPSPSALPELPVAMAPTPGEGTARPQPGRAGVVTAAQVKTWDAARDGAFIDLARSYGAGYDEATGLFSLNGLTDITMEQMRKIVAAGVMTNDDRNTRYVGLAIRTHLPQQIRLSVAQGAYTFRHSAVEVVDANLLVPGQDCFYRCLNLRRIRVYSPNCSSNVFLNTYAGCAALETLTVSVVYARSFSLADSPLISLDSLKGIIGKAQAGSAAITISVHPTVYAKITGDPDTDRPNGWTSLPELAAAKNITFITV